MISEYEGLRNEIVAWQERRFTVLAGSIALVVGILGLKMVGESKPTENWPWATALLLALMAAACALTWYAGRANAKIAAYLVVFYENADPRAKWETRLRILKGGDRHPGGVEPKGKNKDFWMLNRVMIFIYFGLGILAVLAPLLSHRDYCLDDADIVVLAITGLIFVFSLVLLGLPAPTAHFEQLWKEAKAAEEKAALEKANASAGGRTG